MNALSVQPFPLEAILLPTAFIFMVGAYISFWATRSPVWSIILALIKGGLFFSYYAFFFDGTFTFLDDWHYLRMGSRLKEQGISVINFMAHLPTLFATAGGTNFFYYVFNADSFRLFGAGYYAPVALNIILSFVAAVFTAKAAHRAMGLPWRLAGGLFVFMAINPDILAWSTIMNGKDTLMLAGTMMVVYSVAEADTGHYRRALAVALPTGFLLFFTRYYVPVMLVIALMGAILVSRGGRRSPALWVLGLVGSVAIFRFMGLERFTGAFGLVQEHFSNPLFGIVRFILTPIPFHTSPQYVFLDLPQIIYWALMPLLIYGIIRVWRLRTLTSRFVVIYFLMMLVLYGIFTDLQGPRHRVQIDGLIALFQFFGLLGFLHQCGITRSISTRKASYGIKKRVKTV